MPGYNPVNFHPVVVNYRGRQPWVQYRDHRARYYRPVVVTGAVVVDRRDNNSRCRYDR